MRCIGEAYSFNTRAAAGRDGMTIAAFGGAMAAVGRTATFDD